MPFSGHFTLIVSRKFPRKIIVICSNQACFFPMSLGCIQACRAPELQKQCILAWTGAIIKDDYLHSKCTMRLQLRGTDSLIIPSQSPCFVLRHTTQHAFSVQMVRDICVQVPRAGQSNNPSYWMAGLFYVTVTQAAYKKWTVGEVWVFAHTDEPWLATLSKADVISTLIILDSFLLEKK